MTASSELRDPRVQPRILVTSPGKVGDTILQMPIPYHFWKETGKKVVLGLTNQFGVPHLHTLLREQPFVQDIVYLDGIENDSCGGQPWDFGGVNWTHGPVRHLGYRQRPIIPLTLASRDALPINASDDALLNEPFLTVPKEPLMDHQYAVFFLKQYANWQVAVTLMRALRLFIPRIYAVGLPSERAFLRSQLSDYCSNILDFEDNGDLMQVARLVRDASLVVGINSFTVTLAHAMKTPCIVVHRYSSPEQTWRVFANYGEDQFNYYPQEHGDWRAAFDFAKELEQRRGYGWMLT